MNAFTETSPIILCCPPSAEVYGPGVAPRPRRSPSSTKRTTSSGGRREKSAPSLGIGPFGFMIASARWRDTVGNLLFFGRRTTRSHRSGELEQGHARRLARRELLWKRRQAAWSTAQAGEVWRLSIAFLIISRVALASAEERSTCSISSASTLSLRNSAPIASNRFSRGDTSKLHRLRLRRARRI